MMQPHRPAFMVENEPRLDSARFRRRHRPKWTLATGKQWLREPQAKDQRYARWIVLFGMGVGMAIALGLAVYGYFRSNRARYELVMHDSFASLSSDNWVHEQQLGGFVEGSFDITTAAPENSWVEDGRLHIRPTLHPGADEYDSLDLTTDGSCTSDVRADCYAYQNTTASTAIPNVLTARLRSRRSITFGKVEVVAKFPAGDWIFSTIGLSPASLIYGQFPASGLIDIAQVRGNARSFPSGGHDKVDTVVHFGADGHAYSDAAQSARETVDLARVDFSARYHTFGLEWTPTHIRTWLDYPSNTMMSVTWPKGFWRKANYAGKYPNDVNFEYLADPWTNGSLAAPYDVPFYLTLRTNVGAVNGIFADSVTKPWYDAAGRGAAMIAFQKDVETWNGTWGNDAQHTMYVKDVKMWQQVNAHVAL